MDEDEEGFGKCKIYPEPRRTDLSRAANFEFSSLPTVYFWDIECLSQARHAQLDQPNMHDMPTTEPGLVEDLPTAVRRKYDTAKAGKALIFSETRLAIIHMGRIPFQLRFCPALSKKPIDNRQQGLDFAPPPKPDPFENPSDALLIARVPVHDPTHALILNKFPVIPQHFIVATISYKEQTQLLEVEDLQVTYACLEAWEVKTSGSDPARRLFAFFNSGEHSGASQSHRHLQFLPVESMRGAQAAWKPLIDFMGESSPNESTNDLPFTHFHARLPSDPSPSTLLEIYTSLYQKAEAAEYKVSGGDVGLHKHNQKAATISYNLAMTTTTMAICPRRSEGATLLNNVSLTKPGPGEIALNGTLLAGTLMVKNECDWNQIHRRPGLLDGLLKSIGVPTHPTTPEI